MDNNTFDSQLKSALENLEAPFDPTAWATFEQRLPAPAPTPEDAVDQAVLRSLEQLEVPYQPAHWEQLNGQLKRIEQLRHRIYVSKSAELAILLLLLLLAGAYGFFGFEPYYRTAPDKAPAQNMPMAESGKAKRHSNARDAANENIANDEGFFVPLDAAQRAGHQAIAQAGVVSENALTPLELASAVIHTYGQHGEATRSVMLPFDPLSAKDFMTLSIADLLNPLKEVTPKAPMANHFYAVTYASLDHNRVRIGAENRQGQGYGGGVMVGYRPGKWGVEAGIAFSQKNYTPLKEVDILADQANHGYYRSFAREVDADIVSATVKGTRRVARFGKTSVHATAGVTANVAVEKSYRYRKDFYNGMPPSGSATIQQTDLSQKTGQGMLEGGQFNDNAYVTADLGLRVERPLGKRLVAFVEPVYQHNISGQGIGPKPAKINTVGLHAGVMASL